MQAQPCGMALPQPESAAQRPAEAKVVPGGTVSRMIGRDPGWRSGDGAMLGMNDVWGVDGERLRKVKRCCIAFRTDRTIAPWC